MLISTRGRYVLRMMIDLAENGSEKFTPLKTIAERQGLSLKYVGRIIPELSNAGLLEGVQGKGGGYRLCRRPSEYTVGEILRLTEGNLAPVSCLECNAPGCEKKGNCRTLAMWTRFHRLINDYFDGITLESLMQDKDAALLNPEEQ